MIKIILLICIGILIMLILASFFGRHLKKQSKRYKQFKSKGKFIGDEYQAKMKAQKRERGKMANKVNINNLLWSRYLTQGQVDELTDMANRERISGKSLIDLAKAMAKKTIAEKNLRNLMNPKVVVK